MSLLTQKTSYHYELHLWPPVGCGLGKEPATLHTLFNFPRVVFLMVTDTGIANPGLSHGGSPVVAVGFWGWAQLSFPSGKTGPGAGRVGLRVSEGGDG